MSLINEALKEARHEATRQDSRKGSSLYPRVPRHGPRRRRRWGRVAIAAAVFLVVIAAATLWIVGQPDPMETADSASTRSPGGDRMPDTATAAPLETAPIPAPSEGEPTALEPASESVAPPVSSPPGAGEAETRPEPSPRTDERRSPAEAAPRRETAAEVESAPEVESASTRSTPATSAGSSVIYRREAQLGDGTRLTLGGIAWSPTQPVALLNGRVIGIGEKVQGFTLRQVYPREVHLSRGDSIIILTTE